METFAEYILSEKDYIAKTEIAYYLSKRERLFFDKSVIFKTEIARLFMDTMKIDVDTNLVITASLLYSCKRFNDTVEKADLEEYTKEETEYLELLGFDEKFCNLCKQINGYNKIKNRDKAGDILELVDNFGEMLLNKPEREACSMDEALTLLKDRNLKGIANQYLKDFVKFIDLEEVKKDEESIENSDKRCAISKLAGIMNDPLMNPKTAIKRVYQSIQYCEIWNNEHENQKI